MVLYRTGSDNGPVDPGSPSARTPEVIACLFCCLRNDRRCSPDNTGIQTGTVPKWALLVAILCLTVFGQSLVLYLSHQRYKEATLQQFKMDKTSLMLEHTLAKGEPPSDPEARKQHKEFIKQFESAKQERRDKEQQLLEISSYLQHRISPVARLETPWPQLFWFIELILCCVAAIWASLQVTRPESPASTAEAPPLDKS